MDENPPSAAKLSASKRKEFFDSSREQIRSQAEYQDNSLAWYLLSLENDDVGMLKRAADGGNVQALNTYGTYLLTDAARNAELGTNDLVRLYADAYRYFKWASDQGDINGMYNLGTCLMGGYGCKRDEKMAFDCFRTAAEAGHPAAINNLGGFFRDGVIVRRDPAISTAWFKKSCELGNDYGMLNYALAMLGGEGVERSQKNALKIFRYLAEKRNNPEAMNIYGMCLLKGLGVDKDEKAAIGWFEKSAAAGFSMAMDNLAMCYERGVGVASDLQKSLEYSMRARAAAGDRQAAEWLKNVRKEK